MKDADRNRKSGNPNPTCFNHGFFLSIQDLLKKWTGGKKNIIWRLFSH